MKLPNYERAIVPREKILQYLLSAEHASGRHKATFFLHFGFSVDSWQTLVEALRLHATAHEVTKRETTPFGVRYVVEGDMLAPDGRTPFVRVVWFVRSDRDAPYFVTAYPQPRNE